MYYHAPWLRIAYAIIAAANSVPAMKLNLPNYDCVLFVVEASFDVSPEQDVAIRAIVASTSSHVHAPDGADDDEEIVAVFGSKFVIGASNYRAVGNLSIAQRAPSHKADVWLMTHKASDTLARPPRAIKSVTTLTESTGRLLDQGTIECNATFEYSPSSGYVSSIDLPIPLINSGNPGGITHIESAEFSSRSGDSIDYRVVVSNDEERNVLAHTVNFSSVGDLSRRSLRGLLGRASALSRQLLVQEGDN